LKRSSRKALLAALDEGQQIVTRSLMAASAFVSFDSQSISLVRRESHLRYHSLVAACEYSLLHLLAIELSLQLALERERRWPPLSRRVIPPH